jgi:signal transduction histidine kinase
MDALITDLLTLAREGQRVGETEVVALGEAARDSWAAVDTRSATLEVVDDRELAADPDRLASLLENLFRNAVEHGGPDVRVTVAGTADGFAVADDGPGIPPEDRDRVFERGYSTGDHGTGFGLSIARGIAEAHGWSIRATGSDAGGARFEVTGVDREATT